MNAAQLTAILGRISQAVDANREYLTDLDRAIGDADHGTNLSKGFRAVTDKLQAATPADPDAVLKTTGMTLISTVGGASGPLYGTAFLRAAAATAGKGELGRDDLVPLLTAALGGIKERGKAERGDKTMVDALEPALEALTQALAGGATAADAVRQAAEAAENGAVATRDIVARKGRASYLGERSIGHQDPGATSTALLLRTLAAALAEGV